MEFISSIAFCIAMMAMVFAQIAKFRRTVSGEDDPYSGTAHVQARRGSSETLDKYKGEFGEIALDMTNWNIRFFDGEKVGGIVVSGKKLYNMYKKTNKFIFRNGNFRKGVGGNSGIRFFKTTEKENSTRTGLQGEIVELSDIQRLCAHDGKTVGGFVL